MYFRPCLKFKNHVSIPSVLGWSRPTSFKSRLRLPAVGWLFVKGGRWVYPQPTRRVPNQQWRYLLGGTPAPNWQEFFGSFPRSFALFFVISMPFWPSKCKRRTWASTLKGFFGGSKDLGWILWCPYVGGTPKILGTKWVNDVNNTSSTAQGGGGSFKNRKRIGEIDCCEWRMSEQKHWPTD